MKRSKKERYKLELWLIWKIREVLFEAEAEIGFILEDFQRNLSEKDLDVGMDVTDSVLPFLRGVECLRKEAAVREELLENLLGESIVNQMWFDFHYKERG